MRELYQAAVGGVGHALNDEQLSNSLTSTLVAVIRSEPARPDTITWPDGWRSTTAVRRGTTSR